MGGGGVGGWVGELGNDLRVGNLHPIITELLITCMSTC